MPRMLDPNVNDIRIIYRDDTGELILQVSHGRAWIHAILDRPTTLKSIRHWSIVFNEMEKVLIEKGIMDLYTSIFASEKGKIKWASFFGFDETGEFYNNISILHKSLTEDFA